MQIKVIVDVILSDRIVILELLQQFDSIFCKTKGKTLLEIFICLIFNYSNLKKNQLAIVGYIQHGSLKLLH